MQKALVLIGKDCAHAHEKYFEFQSRATMEVIGFKTIDVITLF